MCTTTPTNDPIPSGAGIIAAGVTKAGNGTYSCSCFPEYLGHGYGVNGCSGNGWIVRVLYENYVTVNITSLSDPDKNKLLGLLGAAGTPLACNAGSSNGCDKVTYAVHGTHLAVNIFFHKSDVGKTAAHTAASNFNASPTKPSGVVESVGARVYSYDATAFSVSPLGMEVVDVQFETPCAKGGCWVVTVDFTVGHSDKPKPGQPLGFSTFYLPYAPGSDNLSYDYAYTTSILNTYLPKNFPCNSVGSDASNLPVKSTMCCFGQPFTENTSFPHTLSSKDGLLGNYRVTQDFYTFANNDSLCTSGYTTVPADTPKPEDVAPNYQTALGFWAQGQKFVDMPDSPGITNLSAVDVFVGMYRAVIKLDEVELRKKAALLVGTVSVEHTLDFFVGWANFKPAIGTKRLDTTNSQINIHVEKTSFFTVSTHGTNDYTFLEYVNLRLITILKEDTDNSGAFESTVRTTTTNNTQSADYVQVTFTLDTKYIVAPEGAYPLIPLDGVRAGKGTFFDVANAAGDLTHKCLEYNGTTTASGPYSTRYSKDLFNNRLAQTCAPASTMCVSPASIPNSFVSFNIPLGIDELPDAASTMENNIFVEFVIEAYDKNEKLKVATTLTASIPVVAGGLNIFCDLYTAKTDLQDVANADIVLGSARSDSELELLQKFQNIASTQLGSKASTKIDSASIEGALMTLVLKGNESYFSTNPGRSDVTIELEDVITIHIMDDQDGKGTGNSVDGRVQKLLSDPPDDNQNVGGLDTDGYALNGAFGFTIDRAAQRAHLEPLPALSGICPFTASRPLANNNELETCVTRRDVRFRNYPWRTGALSTAMEICVSATGAGKNIPTGTCPSASSTESKESKFMETIFGKNDVARQLGVNYAKVIAKNYDLNGRYRRAYWINPGYEWTPTQTGNVSPFQVSQKLYMFALITLDEGVSGIAGKLITDAGPGPGYDSVGPSLRRRMLLQSTTDKKLQDGQSSVGGEKFEFETSMVSMMASTFGVTEDKVATFNAKRALTEKEACMDRSGLQTKIRLELEDYLKQTATKIDTVQITKLSATICPTTPKRRSIRSLLAASDASVDFTFLVVFAQGVEAKFNVEKFASVGGFESVDPVVISPKINTSPGVDYTPPPEDKDNNKTAIIAGVVGGVGGAIILAGAALLYFKKKSAPEPVLGAVQSISVADLKQQLAEQA